MNEYQKAFKKIDDYVWGKDEPHWQEISSAFEKIAELVDRATPKKPVLFGALSSKVKVGECQKCGTPSMSGRDNYCYECGQALDWEND